VIIPVYRMPKGCKDRSRAVVVAHAVVDNEDAHLAEHFWTLSKNGYAQRSFGRSHRCLHHDVAGKMPGLQVSHKDADRLNNRRGNLKVCTRSENQVNPADGALRNNRSCGMRGVTRDRRPHCRARPWFGQVQFKGARHYTGYYPTAEEAALALADIRARLGVV